MGISTGPAPGASLSGPSLLYHPLGERFEGGMCEVHRALDLRTGLEVALKWPKPAYARDPEFLRRFTLERQALQLIRDEHVVPILDLGDLDGVPYIVMPWLRGETLADRLRRGPLPPEEVARLGEDVSEGLCALHGRGLVHRDIKPGNIWLESTGPATPTADRSWSRAIILDLGLVRGDSPRRGETSMSMFVGTPGYASPEQSAGQHDRTDARSDLFSLGCVLYEALTGAPAFTGKGWLETIQRVATAEPKAPRSVSPSLPGELSDLIMSLLAKKPTSRPDSAGALRGKFRQAVVPPSIPVRITRWAVGQLGKFIPRLGFRPSRAFRVLTGLVRQVIWGLAVSVMYGIPTAVAGLAAVAHPAGASLILATVVLFGLLPGVVMLNNETPAVRRGGGRLIVVALLALAALAVRHPWFANRVRQEITSRADRGSAGTVEPGVTSPESTTPDPVPSSLAGEGRSPEPREADLRIEKLIREPNRVGVLVHNDGPSDVFKIHGTISGRRLTVRGPIDLKEVELYSQEVIAIPPKQGIYLWYNCEADDVIYLTHVVVWSDDAADPDKRNSERHYNPWVLVGSK